MGDLARYFSQKFREVKVPCGQAELKLQRSLSVQCCSGLLGVWYHQTEIFTQTRDLGNILWREWKGLQE